MSLSVFTSEIIGDSPLLFYLLWLILLSMVEVNPLPTLRLALTGRKE